MKRSFAFAIALAVVIGYGLSRSHLLLASSLWAVLTIVLAAAISFVSWKLFYRKKPFTETRRYARAMFHSGIITMEELQRFYDTHPEKEDFDGNGNG